MWRNNNTTAARVNLMNPSGRFRWNPLVAVAKSYVIHIIILLLLNNMSRVVVVIIMIIITFIIVISIIVSIV